jgi:hypothetical protein
LPVLGHPLHPREPIERAFADVTAAETRLLDALQEWFGEGPIYRELAAGFLSSGVSFPSANAKQQFLVLAEAFRKAQKDMSDAVSDTIIQDRGLSHRASHVLFRMVAPKAKFRNSSSLSKWGIKIKKVPNTHSKTYPRHVPDIPESKLAILVAFSKQKVLIDWNDALTARAAIEAAALSSLAELSGMVVDASRISIGNRVIPLDVRLVDFGVQPGSALLLDPGLGFAQTSLSDEDSASDETTEE